MARISEHNTLVGMDEELQALVKEDQSFGPGEESLVRRAAFRYSKALEDIKEMFEKGEWRECIQRAKTALEEIPTLEETLDGEHISVRMCQWITRDRYINLAWIADCDPADEAKTRATIEKQLTHASATLEFR